jgi:hypothetical protein
MSGNFLEDYMRIMLKDYAPPFVEMIRASNTTGARDLLRQIESEYPMVSPIMRSLFSGPPAQIVESIAALWPDVRDVPKVEAFAELLQQRLLEEWNKPRGVQGTRNR